MSNKANGADGSAQGYTPSDGEILAHKIQGINQYDWSHIVELLSFEFGIDGAAKHIDYLYRQLIDYILNDNNFAGGFDEFTNAMWFLRELGDVLKAMDAKETKDVDYTVSVTARIGENMGVEHSLYNRAVRAISEMPGVRVYSTNDPGK